MALRGHARHSAAPSVVRRPRELRAHARAHAHVNAARARSGTPPRLSHRARRDLDARRSMSPRRGARRASAPPECVASVATGVTASARRTSAASASPTRRALPLLDVRADVEEDVGRGDERRGAGDPDPRARARAGDPAGPHGGATVAANQRRRRAAYAAAARRNRARAVRRGDRFDRTRATNRTIIARATPSTTRTSRADARGSDDANTRRRKTPTGSPSWAMRTNADPDAAPRGASPAYPDGERGGR